MAHIIPGLPRSFGSPSEGHLTKQWMSRSRAVDWKPAGMLVRNKSLLSGHKHLSVGSLWGETPNDGKFGRAASVLAIIKALLCGSPTQTKLATAQCAHKHLQ